MLNLNQPEIPQYRSAISIIKTIEKLTYRKFGNTNQLEMMAQDIEKAIQELKLMSFSNLMRLSIFIMTVTTAQMGLMVIHTINAFKMFSCLTGCTNHLIFSE